MPMDNKTPQEIISSLMLENAKLVAQLKELRDYLDDMVKEINREVGL
jgi:cell division protein FtsB